MPSAHRDDLRGGRLPHRPRRGDPAVQTFAAAVVGVMIPAIVRWAGDPSQNLPELVDTALARLAAGLPL
ncbi:hypothetical protein ACFQX6_49970 [Streptosporangium lutulentum]